MVLFKLLSKRKVVSCILAATLTTVWLAPAQASDLQREKRMADEIVDAILDGDAVFLKAADDSSEHEFLSIYTEAADEPARGTAIILHGRGFHPDWQDAINPLRVGLTESGWNTLSVQMPVLEKQAKYYDYLPLFPQAIPRIEAAIAYAREELAANDVDGRVVLIAHSCGAHMAMAWADVDSFESIDAYVGVGMGATDYKQPMLHPFPLGKIKVPVLDVYAQNDFPAVIKMAPDRLAMIKKAGNKKSAQAVVEDSDHYYTDRGDALTEVISDWLQTL
jgi:pimeloyl-ACP methyl ester carboxylesterase